MRNPPRSTEHQYDKKSDAKKKRNAKLKEKKKNSMAIADLNLQPPAYQPKTLPADTVTITTSPVWPLCTNICDRILENPPYGIFCEN